MDTKMNVKKRLKIQSWRRGMKEMDLILGSYIDNNIHILNPNEIADYERLLLQDDQLLFSWFSNEEAVPAELYGIFSKISNFIKSKKLK